MTTATARRYHAALAGTAEEPEIRALLRQPLDGAMRVSLEREPDSRLAAGIEGDRHFALAVRDGDGRVVAIGSRAVRTVWLDGEPARLGYIGQLRRDPSAAPAAGPILRAGFATLASTREPGELPFDLTSIAADNRPARRLLERGLRGVPPYRPLGELVTCFVPARGGRLTHRALPAVLPGGARMAEVAACLARNLARHQLAPVWSAADLASGERCRGLAGRDVFVVPSGGTVRGCAALWDQRAFKQTRIHGYPPALARLRPLLNPLLRLRGAPPLPAPGSTLAAAFLSHAAVDGDDPDAFLALVESARAAARARGIDWLVTGFVAGHPLLAALLRAARPRTYHTLVYAICCSPDAALPAFATRRLHVEPAVL